MKQYTYLFLMLGFLFLMLCFPTKTFDGAANGLLLWFQIILPTLLPFIILSNILIQTNCVYYISRTIKPFIQKFFQVSDDACYAIFIGFLCGYPMGAKVIGDLIISKRITLSEGQYLLSFCNNPSPMFIISYIVMQQFHNPSLILQTLLLIYLTPILCSFIFRFFHKNNLLNSSASPCSKTIRMDFELFDTSIMNGFESITKVGGYIMLFSILFTLGSNLQLNWFLPLLEISNGIPLIIKTSSSLKITYPYILGLTSFGGLCSLAQTKSMIQNTGLKLLPYIIEKLVTALATSILAYFMII